MLLRNFLREILSTLPRLLAVIIVTIVGLIIYVGMGGVAHNLTLLADSYYKEQNVADFWVTGSQLTKAEEKKFSQLEGVLAVQSRVTLEAQPVRDDEVTVMLHAVSGDFDINRPYIISGRLPLSDREFVLYDAYAEKHHITVGDTYTLQIKGTEQRITLTVSGLVRSPEYIYNTSSLDPIPDNYKLGFAYMKAESVRDILGENNFNQICIKLDENADVEQFKQDVNKILETKTYSLVSFSDNPKASMLMDTIETFESTTTGLPTLIFLVSALIMFTAMSRIIENARMQIGTLKALGYRNVSIFLYYIAYAQTVIILGILVGTLLSAPLTDMLLERYREIYSMPDFTTKLGIGYIFRAIIIANIFCTGPSIYICAKQMKEMPAECMRPKKPKEGRENIVERIGFVWKKMSFTAKTVVRNIFRNKMRLVMCVGGIAACMALIITAFGKSDANDRFFDTLFNDIQKYNLQVTLYDDVTAAQLMRLQSIDGINKYEYQMGLLSSITNEDKTESTNIVVVEDEISLMLLDMDGGGTPMKMPTDGAIISSTLAEELNLRTGDVFYAKIDGNTISLRVSQILENINGVYAGKSLWRNLGQGFKPTVAYIDTSSPETVKSQIAEYDFVSSVKLKEEIVSSIEMQLETVKSMVFVLSLAAGILAFVVLYNLGIINYYERLRELATLMVLGFYNKEIKALVLRENIIFAIIGILLGIPLGILLNNALLGSSESAGYEINAYIRTSTFFIAAGLTFLYSWVVNLTLGRKFKEIDMVGALKSIE